MKSIPKMELRHLISSVSILIPDIDRQRLILAELTGMLNLRNSLQFDVFCAYKKEHHKELTGKKRLAKVRKLCREGGYKIRPMVNNPSYIKFFAEPISDTPLKGDPDIVMPKHLLSIAIYHKEFNVLMKEGGRYV